MSINALNWVAQNSASKANDRLVLFGIADAADKFGRNSWPTIETLAEFANVDKRTVQRAIQSLEELDELTVERNKGGGADWRGNRRPNRYALPKMVWGDTGDTPNDDRADTPKGDTSVVIDRGDRADTPSGLGVTNDPCRGDKLPDLGVTLLSQEQNQNTPIEHGEIAAALVDNSTSASAKFAALRELGGYAVGQ